MAFRTIYEKRASSSGIGAAVVVALSAMLLAAGVTFAYLFISGKGSDYMLGTMLAFELLCGGVAAVLYGKFFISFRKVSEDRDEELLW